MDPQFAVPENWKPPRELMRALPRETRMTARGRFQAIMAAVFLLATIPLYAWMHNDAAKTTAQNDLLRAAGAETKGEIARLWRRDRGRVPMVGYAFTANGVRITGEAEVPSDKWAGIQKAGFMPIRYLPSNPTINHPADWDASTSPAWLPIVFPAFLALSAAFLLWTLHRQSQIVSEGVPAPGVVNKCVRIKNGWIVRYQFRLKDGTTLNGRDRAHGKLEPGAPICILYRPDDPRRNQLYPNCLYRVVTQ